ncbi:hypothetical protein OS493_032666 [Desmophyllum pertusum]|uniref:Uncharacterized protein n=1 Tax=Desmophyllum pertusum TaxID=174260 RepID=A0A9W9YBF8_9CNID|nr:hypothetical protein OS493_032666 [Desmophyllum pertusum]
MAASKSRKNSRINPPPILKDYVVDGFEAESETPQQLSDAVKPELNQVESMIKHLTPLNHGVEQHNQTASSADPSSVKPTLKTLQQDPAVQTELTDLMNSLGEPVLLGLTDEQQDPAQKLLEPVASRGKHPLLIPDSELAKCYPLPRVIQYDDLFRRMQFATNCKWGIDSQFISQQTLQRPDPPTTTPPRQPPRKPSRPVINQATGKQICYEFQRREGCRLALPADTTMSALSPSALDLTHNGSTHRHHP